METPKYLGSRWPIIENCRILQCGRGNLIDFCIKMDILSRFFDTLRKSSFHTPRFLVANFARFFDFLKNYLQFRIVLYLVGKPLHPAILSQTQFFLKVIY